MVAFVGEVAMLFAAAAMRLRNVLTMCSNLSRFPNAGVSAHNR
jgi:hypothetical protein